ncbi:MFS transporter [Paracoccus laeviglucosivorans]|uniref:MFS transporter, putative signal transducer n=1 Tax=Paracoccus laeviglucosivorans TaxID=1197861 RepID=A0A521F4A5_9RHOB|nr:MFS transporter [Paracoccus laeviglucosivorans]SMO90350.1 MFS transporter, putative signal transducer [Paracoccus laeviglucosivorans]
MKNALPVALMSLGGLYVSQSVLGGFMWTALPAYLRSQGMALDHLGFLSLLVLPWALKMLWSPQVERWRRPAPGITRTRGVILIGWAATVLTGIGLIWAETAPFAILLAGLMLIATATATVDIACDGHAVEAFAPKDYGWANAMQVGGAYAGAALGGGLVLVALGRWGWGPGMMTMLALMLLCSMPFVLLRQPQPLGPPAAAGPSLRAALARPTTLQGLAVTALYVSAMKSSTGYFGPFLVDSGFSLTNIGIFGATGAMITGLAGAMLGGLIVSALGAPLVLLAALGAQAVVLIYCMIAASGASGLVPGLPWMVQIVSPAFMAVGFVALYARFMAWSDPAQAGVDFTIFQCADALISMAFGVLAGQIISWLGYPAQFGLSLALSALCFARLRALLPAPVQASP